MKRFRILIDLDGIIVNLQDSWYREYNEIYGDSLSPEKVTDWDTARFAKHGAKVFDVLKRLGFYLNLPELPGAVAGVRALVAAGHDIYIVSSAPQLLSYTEKAQWVQEHIPEFDLRRIVLTYSKTLVKGDILFDDGPHNITGYRKEWPDAKIATIEYPYNTEALTSANFIAGHWREPEWAWQQFVGWVEWLANAKERYDG